MLFSGLDGTKGDLIFVAFDLIVYGRYGLSLAIFVCRGEW